MRKWRYCILTFIVIMWLVLPSASMGNGKIAFTSNREGLLQIYLMNEDGTDQTRLTDIGENYEPAWFPDGSKIAYTSNRNSKAEIYVMNNDGSNPISLTPNIGVDSSPSWSPDGTKIAFSSYRDSDTEIYVMNADGSNQIRLTNSLNPDGDPTWSPDGKKITFDSKRDGGLEEIYIMNADGSDPTRLTFNVAGDFFPAWSPDGTKIAFTSNRDGHNEIYVMKTDGTEQSRLTSSSVGNLEPAWSPDGKKIAFTSQRNGNEEIYVMNADGTGQIRLTNDPAYDFKSAWGRIPNQPPVADAGSDRTVIANELVTFDGSGSSDSDGTIETYAWNFGDSISESGETTLHTYTAAGIYTVTLTVTDNEGLTGSDTAVITVKTPGRLEIKSSPSHAKIYINGIDTEKYTKWASDNIAPGNYDVYVTLDGYATPATQTVKVISGQTVGMNFRLQKIR